MAYIVILNSITQLMSNYTLPCPRSLEKPVPASTSGGTRQLILQPPRHLHFTLPPQPARTAGWQPALWIHASLELHSEDNRNQENICRNKGV